MIEKEVLMVLEKESLVEMIERLEFDNETYKDANQRYFNYIERLKKLIKELEKENTDLKKLHNDIENEIRRTKDENQLLRDRLQNMIDVCDGSCFSDKEEDDRDKLLHDLQDQHQQDCIRINDLTTTVHVLAGLYSALRKNAGMD